MLWELEGNSVHQKRLSEGDIFGIAYRFGSGWDHFSTLLNSPKMTAGSLNRPLSSNEINNDRFQSLDNP